jgi:uncharacterized protein GlcG (DUF336 family)
MVELRKLLLVPSLTFGLVGASFADLGGGQGATCGSPDLAAAIASLNQGESGPLGVAANLVTGNPPRGLFSPKRLWWAVVDRSGRLCAADRFGVDPWPDSRAIAIAKAGTANGFSNDNRALSTANLYAASQPGGAMFGLNNSNPFNPAFQPLGTGIGEVPGGIITVGGGVALYSGGQVIGGLGISGDTPCIDHEIAYKVRQLLVRVPGPTVPNANDNIIYPRGDKPSGFEHPRCAVNFGRGKDGHLGHDRDDKDDKDGRGDKDDKDKRDGKGGKY